LTINTLHRAAQNGDSNAEGALFALLSARFRYFAEHKIESRDDAEEIVQEALKTILDKYRDIEFTTSFAAWAYKVLDNKILAYFRRSTVQRERMKGSTDADETPVMTVEETALERQLLECLRKLHAANRRHARVLNLHYLGFTVEEICRRVDVTRNNLYSLLHRARARLADCLETGDMS